MTKPLLRIAHIFFGLSLIAFGVQQFITAQLVVGRPPAWPSLMAGELIVAYVVGIWLIINGITILINKKINSLIPTALFILIYCASRNLYIILSESDIGASLTNFGKGITLAGGLLLIVVTSSSEFNNQHVDKSRNNFFVLTGIYCLAIFLFIGGIQHFIFADFVKFLIPSWIPFPLFWTYASGVALIIIALSLATGIKRQLIAQIGAVMIFSWVITLHIPRVLQDINNQNEWTSVFEALAFSSLLFIIAKASFVASISNGQKPHIFARSK